jgi:quercetin dioxygenase-like cupin family protein
MTTTPTTALRTGVIPVSEQQTLVEGPVGALELLPASATGGLLSVVVHPLAPRALGSPVHTHRDEDEWSVVLAGTVGVQVAGRTELAHTGDVVAKPRGLPHAFWNPTDEPARLLEIITPGGFEDYFRGLAAVFGPHGPDPEALMALAARHHLDLDPASVPVLAAQHGLSLGPA